MRPTGWLAPEDIPTLEEYETLPELQVTTVAEDYYFPDRDLSERYQGAAPGWLTPVTHRSSRNSRVLPVEPRPRMVNPPPGHSILAVIREANDQSKEANSQEWYLRKFGWPKGMHPAWSGK